MKNSKLLSKLSYTFYILSISIMLFTIFYVISLYISTPKISLKGKETIEIGVGEEYVEPGFNATLNFKNVNNKVIIDNCIDTSVVGEYQIKYSISNYKEENTQFVTRNIKVIDKNAPDISLNGEKEVTIELGSSYKEEGATAIDDVDKNITNKIETDSNINSNKEGEYYITYKVSDNSGNESSIERKVIVKNTKPTILISINEQKIWFYKNGKLIITSDIVSGQTIKDDTPKGTYKIYSKSRNTYLVGKNYRSFVKYWMPFNKSIGLHDASWRNKFGGDIYKSNGSHGCINLPTKTAKTIYENAPVGTIVKVY